MLNIFSNPLFHMNISSGPECSMLSLAKPLASKHANEKPELEDPPLLLKSPVWEHFIFQVRYNNKNKWIRCLICSLLMVLQSAT